MARIVRRLMQDRLHSRAYATESQLVRWFRAVDEPVSKPKKFNYKPAKPPSKFEAFPLHDSRRLEEAFTSGRSHALVETDGLMSVDFAKKVCAPTFYEGPAYAVRRALWFELLNSNKLGLSEEGLESALEAKFREDPEAANFNIEVAADPLKKGSKAKRFQGSFATSDATTARAILQEGDGWLSVLTKREFVRGALEKPTADQQGSKQSNRKPEQGPVKAAGVNDNPASVSLSQSEPETLKHFNLRPQCVPRDIDHLIFCVHGIGQLLSLRYEQVNFVKDVDQFRRELNKAFKRTERDGDNNGVQVLPVMWRHGLDDTVNGLHPQQLFGSVNVAADVVLDFVMYMEEKHRRKILHTAAEEMRRMFRQFCELNPRFAANPKVSIVGHSLGSVIAHDLVSRSDEELPFDVTNLFTMGSPVGILELMHHSKTVDKGKASSMYNILRRADPVAARLEPIVVRRALEVAPRPLPGGGTNLLKQLRDFTEEISNHSDILSTKATAIWNTMISRDKEETTVEELSNHEKEAELKPENAVDLPELRHFNRHGRLDFSVTETMDISLVLGLAGHLMYLDNEDIATFVLKETLEI